MGSNSKALSLIAEIALPLVLIFAVELGFRSYVRASPALGPPRIFDSSISSGKYLAFQRGLMKKPRTDIFLMGLSPVINLNAGRLVEVLAEHGHAVTAFNFAFPFHGVSFDQLLLRDIVLAEQEPPRLIIYGVMPLNLLLESAAMHTEKRTRGLPGFRFHEASAGARLRAQVLRRLRIFLYRDVIRDSLIGTKPRIDPWAKRASSFDDRGDLPPTLERPSPTALKGWEVAKYQEKLKNFLNLLVSGPFADNLGALASFCREHGTRLLLVNTAVSPFFPELLPHGRADYDIFVQRMAAVAAANGISFLDMSGPDLGAPADFVDSHHLNRKAALRATEKIADFVLSQGLLDAAEPRPAP